MNDKNLLTEQNLSKLLEQEAGEINANLDLWPMIQQQLKTTQSSVEPLNDDNSLLLEPVTTGPRPLLTFPRVTKILLGMAAVLALIFIAGATLTPATDIVSMPPLVVGANPTVPATPHAITATLKATLTGSTDAVRALAWKPDGTQLASGSDDGTLKQWTTNGKLQSSGVYPKGVNSLVWYSNNEGVGPVWDTGIVWTQNGKFRAQQIGEKEFQIEQADGTYITKIYIPTGVINQVAVSPDGKTIAASGQTVKSAGWGDIRVWLWRADGSLVATISNYHYPINSMVWSPDSKTVAIAAKGESEAGVWSAEGKSLVRFDTNYVIWAVAWSPDGQTLAAACSDNMVRLFGANGNLEATLTGHQDEVWAVAWSPDGKTLASGSSDKTIKLWEIK